MAASRKSTVQGNTVIPEVWLRQDQLAIEPQGYLSARRGAHVVAC